MSTPLPNATRWEWGPQLALIPVLVICRAQPSSLPAKLVQCVRRGKCTSPLLSVTRSSSCEESSRLYCCHTSRTVMPARGLRAASKALILQSGATICGKGINALASITATATRTIVMRVGSLTLQILIQRVAVDEKSPGRSRGENLCFYRVTVTPNKTNSQASISRPGNLRGTTVAIKRFRSSPAMPPSAQLFCKSALTIFPTAAPIPQRGNKS